MDKFSQLTDKLKELFQLDQPDLDFGFYRVIQQRSAEIANFLENDLRQNVSQAFADGKSSGSLLKEKLDKAREACLAALGETAIDSHGNVLEMFKSLPAAKAYLEAKADYEARGDAWVDYENEVYGHLLRFFSRYYDKGDFISKRRYKGDTYSIPYAGEEVMLHWANKDQYYVKSGESFSNYSFKLANGKRVNFKLVSADTAKDNQKQGDKERCFVLCEERTVTRVDDDGEEYEETIVPVLDRDGELFIHFEYKPVPKKTKQKDLNGSAIETLLAMEELAGDWEELKALRPTDKNKTRTLLEKHLTDYTGKNSSDYFIHKDLGGFLSRELDFYIKNEVMNLDDVSNAAAFSQIENNLKMIQVLRSIALKIIAFLKQLEDFQKKLWLKKKFVVETNYCITLDRIPEDLFAEIAKEEDQWQQWEELGFIEAGTPRTMEYLTTHPHLLVDTIFFDASFKYRLLNSIDNFDEQCDGLLIHSENFQALNLLQEQYKEQVKCVYIDPPYNSGDYDIPYKNNYKHSSWLSLIENRVALSSKLLNSSPIYFLAIDDYEMVPLCDMLDSTLPDFRREMTIVNHHPQGGKATTLSNTHEYMVVLVKKEGGVTLVGRKFDGDDTVERRPFKRSGTAESNHRYGRPNSFYALLVDPKTNLVVGAEPPPPKGEVSYTLEDTDDSFKRVYPIGKGGVERVWRRSYESCHALIESQKLICSDNGTIYQLIESHEKTSSFFSNWTDKKYNASTYGANLLRDIIGNSEFSYPKSLYTVTDAIFSVENDDQIVLDYFAGSGTTGHAVIELNRENDGNRKYILVEMGEYFDKVTKPRIQKVVYAKDWKNGKPVSHDTGISHCFKYLKLESYEDTLNNLKLERMPDQEELFKSDAFPKQDYMMHYMLEEESRGSLLSVDAFKKPFDYQLDIAVDSAGATEPTTIDLVETFNYLIGLKVDKYDADLKRGFVMVEGRNLQDQKILVIWRDMEMVDSERLTEICKRKDINPRDLEYDIVYVNGDNHLPNINSEADMDGAERTLSSKVRLIEDEFLTRMFDVEER